MGNFAAQDFKKFKFPSVGSKTLAVLKYMKESLFKVSRKKKNVVELLFWSTCLKEIYDYSVITYTKYLKTHGILKSSSKDDKSESHEIKCEVPGKIVGYIAKMGIYAVKWIPTGKEIDGALSKYNGEEQKTKLSKIFKTDIEPYLGNYKSIVTEKRFIETDSKSFSSYAGDLGTCVSAWADNLQYISNGLNKIK